MEQSQEQEVILIITDISGYTRFMLSNRQTLLHGQVIISELTKAIIAQVNIPLEISKLEGDAVFLYAMKKNGDSWQAISSQIGQKLLSFLDAFSDKLLELEQSNTCPCAACMSVKNLSLKIVVHSGEALLYQIGKFEELSGVDVIIVHRLLKNSVPAHEYILMTEAAYRDVQFPVEIPVTPGEESYQDIGTISTYVFLPAAASSESVPLSSQKPYSSMFYRWKNRYLKIWKSKLMDRGWIRPPKFNNLPDEIGKS
jgi:Protein of unknown function (DUF2652)